jgi:hypothetical protein
VWADGIPVPVADDVDVQTDSGDKKLYDSPQSTVAVDTALLTRDPDWGLLVGEMARKDVGE